MAIEYLNLSINNPNEDLNKMSEHIRCNVRVSDRHHRRHSHWHSFAIRKQGMFRCIPLVNQRILIPTWCPYLPAIAAACSGVRPATPGTLIASFGAVERTERLPCRHASAKTLNKQHIHAHLECCMNNLWIRSIERLGLSWREHKPDHGCSAEIVACGHPLLGCHFRGKRGNSALPHMTRKYSS